MTIMQRVSISLTLLVCGCTKENIQQCEDNTDCDYRPGGVCTLNSATGRHWCAFADTTCPDGLRWGDITIGDDLAGTCVTGLPDASPGPDANDPCRTAGGQVVFATTRSGGSEIARLLADGTGFQLLTTNAWEDSTPQWSPDGSRIAWLSSPGAQPELYVMNHDGSDQQDVSAGLANGPRWSPDGTRLLFNRSNDIYVVRDDGTGLANLTQSAATEGGADWSPDGSKIVFLRDGLHLYVMNADGSAPMPIADIPDLGLSPRWSPDGAKVALLIADNLSLTLWTINPDGTSLEAVDSSGTLDADGFDWSPDGARIAYSRVDTTGAYSDIFTVTAEGTARTNVTNEMGASQNLEPHWSPDSGRIVFRSERDGNREIYSMNADGTGLANLSNDPGADQSPSWSACP